MRSLVALAALAAGLAFTTPTQAASSPTIDHSGIVQVMDGCGRGGHRDRFGRCRPNYQPEYRRCPYGTHPTPYGCRRNY